MTQLNTDEAMPDDETVYELIDIFFRTFPFAVMNPPRFRAAMQLAPAQRPPVAVQYIVMANAAMNSTKYEHFANMFYQRAVRYKDRMALGMNVGDLMSVWFVQATALLTIFEYKSGMFPQAWMSIGASLRASVMLGMSSLDIRRQSEPIIEAKDNTILLDEYRRTFFTAFCSDRLSASGTGWPAMLRPADIAVHLPIDDDAYNEGRPSKCYALEYLIDNPSVLIGVPSASFAIIVLYSEIVYQTAMLTVFPMRDFDPSPGGSWMRQYRRLEHLAETLCLVIPPFEVIEEDGSLRSYNLLSQHLVTQTALLYLGRCALMGSQYSTELAAQFSREQCLARCTSSAVQIATIVRRVNNVRALISHPYQVLPLYASARFFLAAAQHGGGNYTFRGQLDYLLTVFKIVQDWIPMAAFFYRNILIAARQAVAGDKSAQEQEPGLGHAGTKGPSVLDEFSDLLGEDAGRSVDAKFPHLPKVQDLYADGKLASSRARPQGPQRPHHDHKRDTSHFPFGQPDVMGRVGVGSLRQTVPGQGCAMALMDPPTGIQEMRESTVGDIGKPCGDEMHFDAVFKKPAVSAAATARPVTATNSVFSSSGTGAMSSSVSGSSDTPTAAGFSPSDRISTAPSSVPSGSTGGQMPADGLFAAGVAASTGNHEDSSPSAASSVHPQTLNGDPMDQTSPLPIGVSSSYNAASFEWNSMLTTSELFTDLFSAVDYEMTTELS